ncbi:MAG: trigger factor [Bacteroides sp.]|nr:trigger factor [Bacteroides sp.]
MNVSFQNIDKVSALLTVNIEKADYQANVDKVLKKYRQQANIPGFRKGMVPMALIKKQFGKAVMAEEVDKMMQEKVNEYIRENKVNMLGMPLPNEEKMQTIDFDTQENFEFVFDIALAPEFNAELNGQDAIDFYNITVSDEMVNSQVEMYAQRAAKYEKVEDYQDRDMVKGLMAELDENGNTKEGGIQIEGSVMMPSYMKNDEQKAIFNGAKVNDVLVFNPNAAFEGNEAELSSLLKIKREEVADMKSNFSFQVEEITRAVPAAIDQALFDQVFGEGAVSSEEEFRGKIKAGIAAQFETESNYKFLLDVRTYLMNKVGKLEFSEPLLKKIMLMNNPEKGESFVDENFEKSLEELSWYLVKEQLVEANGIKVEQEDLLAVAKENTRMQFAQYGMNNLPEEMIENYAKEQLKKKENVEGLVNRAVEVKLAAALKDKVALNHKDVTIDEFNELLK